MPRECVIQYLTTYPESFLSNIPQTFRPYRKRHSPSIRSGFLSGCHSLIGDWPLAIQLILCPQVPLYTMGSGKGAVTSVLPSGAGTRSAPPATVARAKLWRLGAPEWAGYLPWPRASYLTTGMWISKAANGYLPQMGCADSVTESRNAT